MVPDIAIISFNLAQLTVKSEQPNFGPVSPHFAEITSPSTDLTTLLLSCGPFGTMTSRSERQDHFGSDFVVIWAVMSFACLLYTSDAADDMQLIAYLGVEIKFDVPPYRGGESVMCVRYRLEGCGC